MRSRLTVLALGTVAACMIMTVGGGCAQEQGRGKPNDYAALPAATRLLTLEIDGPQAPGALEALTALLQSDDPVYRAEAAQTLAVWASMNDACLGNLVPALASNDPLVRGIAQATFIEQNPHGLGLLLVNGNVVKVPANLLKALAQLGDPQGYVDPAAVIMPMTDLMRKHFDGTPEEAVLAADVLARTGDAGARRVLVRIVSTGEGPVLAKAARACVRDDMELGPTLLPVAFQNGPLTRRAVMNALVIRPDPRLKNLPIKGLTDADVTVRHNAIRALGNMDGGASPKELAALLSSKSEEKADVLRALGAIGQPAADILREYIRRGPESEQLEFTAILALSAYADRDDIPWLTNRLRSPSKYVRAAALTALGRIANPEAQAAVVRATSDSDPLVRAMAAKALGQIGTVYGAQQLLVMLNDPDSLVASMAAWGLGHMAYAEAAPALMKLAKQAAPGGAAPGRMGEVQGWPQLAALEALGHIGGDASTAFLRERLAAPLWLLRATAARALGMAGQASPETLKALETAQQDPVNIVRAEACLALQALQAKAPESGPPAKPAEAKPAEAKPAEAKPAEAKPAEAKPAEAAPAKPAEPAKAN